MHPGGTEEPTDRDGPILRDYVKKTLGVGRRYRKDKIAQQLLNTYTDDELRGLGLDPDELRGRTKRMDDTP
jgi:hypothetical protein